MALFECVPNVSEGRDQALVDELAAAASGSGARLLDRTCDPDHHRAVFTLAGEAEPLLAAVEALYDAALPRLDLRRHRGAHPRIGAIDVVPFVPLAGTPMATAVELAHRAGARIAARHRLPVYFYEAAARRPERRALPNVRRGGFEGLAERLSRPEGAPDEGPPRPHPSAGASAFGARTVLVAYNVVLADADLAAARAIAAAVREAGGGLEAVRALGVPLASRGLVQVSMNLLDYRRTAPAAAFARVAELAQRRGAVVVESEIVGLVPRAALAGTSPEALCLAGDGPDKILENRLVAAGLLEPGIDAA